MDEELKKFRQRKLAEERKAKLKNKVSHVWNAVTGSVAAAVLPDKEDESEAERDDAVDSVGATGNVREKRKRRKLADGEDISADMDGEDKKNAYTKIQFAIMFLKILCWVFMWVGFIKIGFGAVFFAISVLYFMWTNMGNSKKRKGHKSAYSVFNENCEAIDGSLKAEQLEKQLVFGSL